MRRLLEHRILAIDPAPIGFGFAVLENSLRLVDWGILSCRKKETPRRHKRQASCVERVETLIARYAPTVIVLEDCRRQREKRCHDTQILLQRIARAARKQHARIQRISQKQIWNSFSHFEPKNKEDIARVLASQFPELLPLPRHREAFMGEQYRMSIYDAAALALTGCFQTKR